MNFFRRALLIGIAAFLPILSTATAQPVPHHESDWASHGLGEVAFLGLNALIGGVTAGVWRELGDATFQDGFAAGALGGSVVYAGKRLAAESFPGAGLLGRDVAAVGSSVVRNASDGRPLLDSLVVPVGPVRLYASSNRGFRPRVEASLPDLYWMTYGLVEDRLRLDLAESLSSGAPVFESDRSLVDIDDEPISGAAAGGVVFLSPLADEERDRVLAHERTHVLQADFIYHAWFRPLEDGVTVRLPRRGFVDRVDYDIAYPTLRWGMAALGWLDRFDAPIQAEADFLEGR